MLCSRTFFIHFTYNSLHQLTQTPNPSLPHPLPLGNHKSVLYVCESVSVSWISSFVSYFVIWFWRDRMEGEGRVFLFVLGWSQHPYSAVKGLRNLVYKHLWVCGAEILSCFFCYKERGRTLDIFCFFLLLNPSCLLLADFFMHIFSQFGTRRGQELSLVLFYGGGLNEPSLLLTLPPLPAPAIFVF